MAKYVSEDGVKAIRDWAKNAFNLGYYDIYDPSTNTITRQTGYLTIKSEDITGGTYNVANSSNAYCTTIVKNYNKCIYNWDKIIGISSNGFEVRCLDFSWNKSNTIGINNDNNIYLAFSTTKTKAEIQALCPIYIQYKLANATTERVEKNHYARYNQDFILEHNKSEAERSANLFSGGVSLMDKGLVVGKQYIITTKNNTIYNFKIATQPSATAGSDELLNNKDNTSTFIFTWNTNKNWNLYVFDTNWVLQNNDDIEIMLNEGTVALPYQPYEGKVIHEKDIKNLSGVIGYGITQLYKHDIEFDISNGDGIKCTFWSTSNVKITNFSQIPYLAFSNIQVKNISSEKILNVVQWNRDGFRFYESDDTGTLIGDAYDGVTAYYINGEPQL